MLLQITLHGTSEKVVTVMVDTGTSAGLFIPRTLAEEMGWPATARYDRFILADERPVKGHWTTGYVKWFGALMQIDVFAYELANDPRSREIPTPGSEEDEQEEENKRTRKGPRYAGLLGMGLLRETTIHIKKDSFAIRSHKWVV